MTACDGAASERFTSVPHDSDSDGSRGNDPLGASTNAERGPRLRLRSIEDLVEAVPFLLGFHPRHSLVLVGLRPAPSRPQRPGGIGHVLVTARLDIADLADDEASAASAGLAADTASSLVRSGSSSAVGILFADADDDAEMCVRAMGAAAEACAAAELEVLDFLVAPPNGASALTGVVTAQATYSGLVAHPDRSALVALLRPAPATERERHRDEVVRSIAARSAEYRAGGEQRWQRRTMRALHAASRAPVGADDELVAHVGAALTDEQVARFGAALADTVLRDSCWTDIDDGKLDGENVWRELAQRLPRPYDAAPLFLFGWLQWRRGNGALAGIAARRALDSDPGYRAAALLQAALSAGMNPFTTPSLQALASTPGEQTHAA